MEESPRTWDNLGTLAIISNRYFTGDTQTDFKFGDFSSAEELFKHVDKISAVYYPVYAYIHGAIALSTTRGYPFNCPFDSALAGVIYAKPDDVRKWYGVKKITEKVRERAKECLLEEVKEYSDYLTGY